MKNPIKKKTPVQPAAPTNFEQATGNEVKDYQAKLREQTKNEQKHIENATSTGYYFCVYFADKEQRDEFLDNAGLAGANIGQYINGERLAQAVGVPLTKKKIDKPKVFRLNKNFKHYARDTRKKP